MAPDRSSSGGSDALLTAQERALLAVVTVKVERLLEGPSGLSAEDWAVLSPLALRLSDLLRQVGKRRQR